MAIARFTIDAAKQIQEATRRVLNSPRDGVDYTSRGITQTRDDIFFAQIVEENPYSSSSSASGGLYFFKRVRLTTSGAPESLNTFTLPADTDPDYLHSFAETIQSSTQDITLGTYVLIMRAYDTNTDYKPRYIIITTIGGGGGETYVAVIASYIGSGVYSATVYFSGETPTTLGTGSSAYVFDPAYLDTSTQNIPIGSHLTVAPSGLVTDDETPGPIYLPVRSLELPVPSAAKQVLQITAYTSSTNYSLGWDYIRLV